MNEERDWLVRIEFQDEKDARYRFRFLGPFTMWEASQKEEELDKLIGDKPVETRPMKFADEATLRTLIGNQ